VAAMSWSTISTIRLVRAYGESGSSGEPIVHLEVPRLSGGDIDTEDVAVPVARSVEGSRDGCLHILTTRWSFKDSRLPRICLRQGLPRLSCCRLVGKVKSNLPS
jgi:hypothetical protein